MPSDNPPEYANKIPPQVRRQVEQAEEIARQIQAQGSPAEDSGAQVPPEDSTEKTPDPGLPVPPVPHQGAELRTPTSEPATEPQPSPAPDSSAQGDGYEQRYRTLQGKYDAEVPRLNNELARFQGENTQLRQLLADLHARAAAPPARDVNSVAVDIPDEDATEYGEDLITAARRWARAEIQPEIEQMRAQLHELRGGQQNIEAQSVQQRIAQGLSSYPELQGGVWQRLNTDQNFMAWLNQADPFAGALRLEMFRHAAATGDVARTARFFLAYLGEHTDPALQQSAPTQTARPTGSGNGHAGPARDLASLAAPGRAAGTATTGAPAKRTWSPAQIQQHFKLVTQGRFRGREAEQRRIEEDIWAAQHDGRIVG